MNTGRQYPDDDLLFQLSAYVDGQLEGEALAAFEGQLAADPALRKELAAFRKVDALARQYRALLPEMDWAAFGEGVRSQREDRSRSASPSFLLRLARPVAAAAVLAFALTAVFLFRQGRTTKPDDPTGFNQETASAWVRISAPDARAGDVRHAGRLSVSVSRVVPHDALATVAAPPSGWALLVTSDDTPPRQHPGDDDSLF